MPSDREPALDVFFSYSHRDEALRDELETHLALLKREGEIRTWHDRRIGAGSEWRGEIDSRLDSADLVLLLISPDFMASDYCFDVEMTRALARHAAQQARVIPVILRPADWQTARFARLQALPTAGKAITTWPDRDSALVDVVRGIRAAIQERRRPPTPPPEALPPAVRLDAGEPKGTPLKPSDWSRVLAAAAVVAVAVAAIYVSAFRGGRPKPTAAEMQRIFAGETTSEEIAGRLAVRLVIPGEASRQVGTDHVFRTGDFFRFAATSNRDGWLYVLHRPPGGELALLWPPGGATSANQVRALETAVVPTGEDAFQLVDNTGAEFFYVALIAASADATLESPEARRRRVEKLINAGGHGSTVAGQHRGVIIARPGEGTGLYFTGAGGGVTAAVELRLRHEK